LKPFCAFISFLWFPGAMRAFKRMVFDEMQVYKTNAEVEKFFAKWVEENSPAEGKEDDEFEQLQECVNQLKKLNGKQLLEHVTGVCKSKKEFNTAWTKSPTHVLGSSLYTDLREWLGAGKW
jgi:hypothetical protein